MAKLYLEKYLPSVQQAGGITTALPVDFSDAPSVALPGAVSTGSQAITDATANAFVVGPAGTTNPTFQVDASTASAVTGIKIKSAAAASGVAVSVISSGTNEALTIDAKGSGGITLNGTGTGTVQVGSASALSPLTVYSTSATSFVVGPAGATNPVLTVDSSQASQTAGLKITGNASGFGVVLAVVAGTTNENLRITAKGTGKPVLQYNTAPAAGGSAAASVGFSSTSNLGLYFGTGSPTVSAAQGSIYIKTDASSTSTRLYINTDGATTWTNFTTAA